MITVNKLIAQGRGLAPVLVKRAATLALDWDTRQKSRFDAEDSQGRTLAVFLPRGSVVRGGDVLVAEDGSLVAVQAAPQPVMVVRPCAEHGQPFDLLRAAYHLGNRHVPVDLRADRLQFEPDPVLAEMLRRMHLTVTDEQAGFEPEGGAYQAGGHSHAHGEAHDHGHAHAHAPAPARGKPIAIAVSAAPAPHVHGPGCGHDHGHGHDHDHKH
jgi:urease accessory protein